MVIEGEEDVVAKQLEESDASKLLVEQRNHCEVKLKYYDFIYELVVSLFRI